MTVPRGRAARAAERGGGGRPALRPVAFGLLAASLGLWSSLATADTATLTRFFDAEARRAAAKRNYRAALEYFLLVDQATPSAGAAYNVAVLAESAGEPAMAFTYLERYLASSDPDAARRADAERRNREVRADLALVRVESDPPGAEVFVDQREHGSYGSTPRTIVVEPGAHEILFDAAAHQPAASAVVAEKGAEARARVVLAPRTGTLRVTTTPAGTPIAVRRGRELVRVAPGGELLVLPIGRYELGIEPRGYRPTSTDVWVEEGVERPVSLSAIRLPPKTGSLLVTAGALAADLYLDGERIATTPATLPRVVVGEHRIELRARGYRSAARVAAVREGQSTFVRLQLEPRRREKR